MSWGKLSIEHCVYIIECKDGSLYTGYTNNLANRLKMHKLGKGLNIHVVEARSNYATMKCLRQKKKPCESSTRLKGYLEKKSWKLFNNKR